MNEHRIFGGHRRSGNLWHLRVVAERAGVRRAQ